MYQYIIYKVTNVVNNKIYIGKHKTKNINDMYLGSGNYLRRSIQKYGKDKFVKEVLYIFESEDEMNKMESEIVNEEFVSRKDVYNIATGGQGGSMGGVNIGPSHVSKTRDISYFDKLREAAKIKFKENMKDETYKKEFGKSVSHGLKDFRENGGICGFINKKHTEEFKKRIGAINSIKQKGEKNSQYGTCWIYNDDLKESKKIKKEDMIDFLENGWLKGRKMTF